MKSVQEITQTVLKAVALGMATAAIVLGQLQAITASAQVSLLALGLFALAVAALGAGRK